MKEMRLQNLTDRIFYLPPDAETDRPILAAICGKQQTLIIDSGNSPAHSTLFMEELANKRVENICTLVLTHWHWDHTFGAHHMNLFTIAHEKTKEALEKLLPFEWTDQDLVQRVRHGIESSFCAEMIKKEYGENRQITIRLPNLTFQERIDVDLGELHCVIEHVGGDHADDSVIIYIEEEKVLFLGDCIYPDHYSKEPRYTVQGVLSILEKLEKYDATNYVMAHETPLSKAEFQGYVMLLRLLCQLTEETEGDYNEMVKALTDQLNREPSKIELEAIYCFTNGYKHIP